MFGCSVRHYHSLTIIDTMVPGRFTIDNAYGLQGKPLECPHLNIIETKRPIAIQLAFSEEASHCLSLQVHCSIALTRGEVLRSIQPHRASSNLESLTCSQRGVRGFPRVGMTDVDEQPNKRQRTTASEDRITIIDFAAAKQHQHAQDHDEEELDAEEAAGDPIDCQELEEAQKDAEMILQDWIIGGTAAGEVIGGTGEAAHGRLLVLHACGVSAQKLDLYNQEVGRAGAERLARALAGGVCDGLQTLDLHRNNIGTMGMMWLSRPLASGATRALHTLNLSCNGIEAAGVGWLALALSNDASSCSGLKTLDLAENRFGPAGAAWLAAALASGTCRDLRTLNLRSNDIQDVGTAWVAKALRSGTCSNLRTLNLDDNQIGDEGAEWLAATLASGACGGLQTLRLEFNEVGEAGADRLTEALAGAASSATVHWGYDGRAGEGSDT